MLSGASCVRSHHASPSLSVAAILRAPGPLRLHSHAYLLRRRRYRGPLRLVLRAAKRDQRGRRLRCQTSLSQLKAATRRSKPIDSRVRAHAGGRPPLDCGETKRKPIAREHAARIAQRAALVGQRLRPSPRVALMAKTALKESMRSCAGAHEGCNGAMVIPARHRVKV